jgi:hypothetical protein
MSQKFSEKKNYDSKPNMMEPTDNVPKGNDDDQVENM